MDEDEELTEEQVRDVLVAVLAPLRDAGVERASARYRSGGLGELIGAALSEPGDEPDGESGSKGLHASLPERVHATLGRLFEESSFELTRLRADDRWVRRGGRVGDALVA